MGIIPPKKIQDVRNVGFISTRLAGTDGVSLETAKWASVLEEAGYECYYFAGELDRPQHKSFLSPKAYFKHEEILYTHQEMFRRTRRPPEMTENVDNLKKELKQDLYDFIDKFKLDLIIAENALAIPANIPLGLAITEVISEKNIPTIAHDHDFFWERKRFLKSCVWDYLNMAFPPHHPAIKHCVINTSGQNQIGLRTGASAELVPNVMDFENPPPAPDEYSSDVRKALGIGDDELFILQPTRIVQRKGIEHAIELVHRLGRKAKLVISHSSGDEGDSYAARIREYSALMKVEVVFASGIIGEFRAKSPEGNKIYSLQDVYPHADLVTYPSTFEGFGNAFLEAVYFNKPIVINNYSIYSHDIKPKGFKVIEIDDYIEGSTIQEINSILDNPEKAREMVKTNYNLALRYYSYKVLRQKLKYIVGEFFGA